MNYAYLKIQQLLYVPVDMALSPEKQNCNNYN